MKNKIARFVFIILFTAFSVAVNFLLGKIVTVFSIPLYLDSIMTISVVALCGLIPGIACAVLSNIFLYDAKSILFSVCHILTVLGAYFVFKYPNAFQDDDEDFGDFDNSTCLSNHNFNHKNPFSLELFLWAGFISAITNTIMGNVISGLLFANGSDNLNSIFIKAIYSAVPNMTFANYLAGFMENIADKILSALVSFSFYKIFRKLS